MRRSRALAKGMPLGWRQSTAIVVRIRPGGVYTAHSDCRFEWPATSRRSPGRMHIPWPPLPDISMGNRPPPGLSLATRPRATNSRCTMRFPIVVHAWVKRERHAFIRIAKRNAAASVAAKRWRSHKTHIYTSWRAVINYTLAEHTFSTRIYRRFRWPLQCQFPTKHGTWSQMCIIMLNVFRCNQCQSI